VGGDVAAGRTGRRTQGYLGLVAITVARVHYNALNLLARATGTDSTAQLEAAWIEVLANL
jgi:hypothetical protein